MGMYRTHLWRKLLAKVFVAVLVIASVMVLPGIYVKAAAAPSLTKSSRNILIGKSYNLDVNDKVKGSKYAWSSSDKKVASVDNKGIVKGLTKGSATITCKVTAPGETYTLTCSVTIIKPAAGFWIKNKVSILNVGQEYDLDRILGPSSSNDKTTWTTSDATIAAPDKQGKFTALKEGTVTITGKTLSGKSDSVTIQVVGKDGIAANQEQLNALLKSGVAKITIKTADEVNLTIPKGDYSKIQLIIDAPKADVTNNGLFASIEVKQIKADTFHENAKGNTITVSGNTARIVVEPGAEVKIVANTDGTSTLRIENNGVVKEVVVASKTKIVISGTATEKVPVTVNAADAQITSEVPLDVTCNKKFELTLLKGAKDTKVQAAAEDAVPEVKGDVTIPVTVGTGDNAVTKEVKGTPIEEETPGNPGGGNPGGDTPSVTSYVLNGSTYYQLSKSYTELTAITVTYAGISYNVSSSMLTDLKNFLSNESTTVQKWNNTTNTTKVYNGQTVRVTGAQGSADKTVTFVGGLLDGKAYTVTVGSSSVTVTSNASHTSFTISKSGDYTLIISGTPSGLTFAPTF